MHNPEMMARIVGGAGFIAALDQSGGSTPKALRGYGVDDSEWSGDDEMFAMIHEMRSRIISAPSFGNGKVIGAILFEKTMDGEVDGTPVPTRLWQRGVVPFLKVDKGLADEADGVQLMNDNPGLEDLCRRGAKLGVFGTKMRSVINSADEKGIAAIVDQQFAEANRILDCGLMPIVEPEVNIKSETRAESDAILAGELARALDGQGHGRRVMLKLSIPVQPDLYAPLIAHPNCARVVALSGGYSQAEACRELAKNHGMIASFSRGLLQDLRKGQSDAEFDRVLGAAIDEIYEASTRKVAA
ncbi:MAG: fructose bisphosphate aldolase [Pacificimonas sp.]|jgi:fructose-bisphosphate aldolase class I|nr:fructose bisphosphate aldolase [Pacificimonas sp.]